VVLIVVAAAIVVGVIIVALGRGGGLAQSTADFVPFDIDAVTATDVALLRPPPALCGYNIPATDQALSRIAQAMTEREVEIATLRRQLTELRLIADAAAARDQRARDQWLPPTPLPPTRPPLGQPPPTRPPLGQSSPGQPPDAAAGGAVTAADPGAPLPSRPSVWRRELAEPQAPWSAWQRPAGEPASEPALDQDPLSEPARDPATDTDPGAPQETAPGETVPGKTAPGKTVPGETS
jgi:hypothetical protein